MKYNEAIDMILDGVETYERKARQSEIIENIIICDCPFCFPK